ncbi:hypothetical protein BDM02DRAFT_3149483 [Thelephora ganbajun]|uniref:Uncharacterized protein n=1 Tax=Thelephora ganbajun TaxID=370292 RepID=A0ACB6Z5M5_THEGA|nr:hypothetical protein BDM02DRAFT_3149483 [Thelephora ganbajun]
MSKRKQEEEPDGEGELIDIDFEFFDPIADIDWHGVKRLLVQLLQADAPIFHLNSLTDLILSQPLIGSTVKCDGRESDPYAFLSVLNLNTHADHPSIKSLAEYFLSKANPNPALRTVLGDVLGSSSNDHVGLILSERLVNMPVQIIPPMYRMLADEIKWAVEEDEPFNFKYYLILARTYHLSPEELKDLGQNSDRSKRRRGQVNANDIPCFFHPEDEQFQQASMYSVHYPFTNAQPREPDAFGLDTRGCLMLVSSDRLPHLISDMQDRYRPS